MGGLSKSKLFLGKKFAPRGRVKIYVIISNFFGANFCMGGVMPYKSGANFSGVKWPKGGGWGSRELWAKCKV